jgi:hypothetical protein
MMVCHISTLRSVVGGIDEGLEQVDRADADDGRGQLDLEHRSVHVAQPLGLVGVLLQVHATDKGLVAADDHHDQQVGDHHHVDQGQHHQHDDGLVQRRDLDVGLVADAGDQRLQGGLVAEDGLQQVHQLLEERNPSPSPRSSTRANAPFFKWFADGKLNVSYNCLDRNVEARPGRQGRHHLRSRRRRSHQGHLQGAAGRSVSLFANGLRRMGIKKGDRVVIYMPMSIEGVVAMQACARIGATHSVVFGGFSAQSLRDRIEDAGAVAVITADEQCRGGKNCR